jgi:hypothetical protein
MPLNFDKEAMMDILACIADAPHAIGASALHHCVLMLEQAGLPVNWKKEGYFDYLTRALEPEAKSLGRRILNGIERTEGAAIDHLDQGTLDAYTREISLALEQLGSHMDSDRVARAEATLREMRAAWI